MAKKILWSISIATVLIIFFIISAVAPVDFTPLDQQAPVIQTYQRLDKTEFHSSEGNGVMKAGWASINITPQIPINMAGYGPRGPYTSILDSLYARTIVFDNGIKEVVVITIDLLLFPRFVKEAVQDSLSNYGFLPSEIFLSATHTHNGFGNWEKSIGGKLLFGDFDEENVNNLIHQILEGVNIARENILPVKIGFEKIDAQELVANRLAGKSGTKDPWIRIISIKNEYGLKAVVASFSGHPVNLDADIWEISRDYPGILVDELEKENNIDFAMFCAGMVGSHNIDINLPKSHERIRKIGKLLGEKIINTLDSVDHYECLKLGGLDITIEMPPSQLKITNHLRIRNWLFNTLMKPLQANIKILEIGDVLLIGMPCDYSGELSINYQLDQFASVHGKKLFITSFNGNYVGYITEDAHYTSCDHDEVKTLNWVGPYKGEYFTEVIKKSIECTIN